MNKTIISALRSYFIQCPVLDEESPIYIDYVGDQSIAYSINKLPGDPKSRTYIDGGGIHQFDFSIDMVEDYSSDVIGNLENIGVMELLEDWIREQNNKRQLPTLPEGKQALRMMVVGGGYMFRNSDNTAIYQIQMKLLYLV